MTPSRAQKIPGILLKVFLCLCALQVLAVLIPSGNENAGWKCILSFFTYYPTSYLGMLLSEWLSSLAPEWEQHHSAWIFATSALLCMVVLGSAQWWAIGHWIRLLCESVMSVVAFVRGGRPRGADLRRAHIAFLLPVLAGLVLAMNLVISVSLSGNDAHWVSKNHVLVHESDGALVFSGGLRWTFFPFSIPIELLLRLLQSPTMGSGLAMDMPWWLTISLYAVISSFGYYGVFMWLEARRPRASTV